MATDERVQSSSESGPWRPGRTAVGVLIGLLLSTVIWVAAPYTRLILRLENISDSYLPVIVLLFAVAIAVVINPLLGCIRRSWMLDRRQLVIILGMTLVATVLPVQGVFYTLPYSLANTSVRLSGDRALADAYTEGGLRDSLFPDPIRYGEEASASETFLGELLPGETIPWLSWLGPGLSWGAFIAFFALMAVGLGMVVLPQWRDNERLSFPLVGIYDSLTETPEDEHMLPALFRQRLFWLGTGAVFFLYFLHGLHTYFPETVPAIPLSWNLQQCFTEEPLRYIPGPIYNNQIYFSFVAIAFFMPTRISFSIWFMMIAYTVYIVVGYAYLPPFQWGTISDHRSGAMLVLGLFVLWLGRRRWLEVIQSVVPGRGRLRRPGDRLAAWMFVAGLIGMGGWFLWAHVPVGWSVLFVLIGFFVCLLVTRFVAETGMPFIRADGLDASLFAQLLPSAWTGPVTAFMTGIAWMFFQFGSRVNITASATHALAFDADGGRSDGRGRRWRGMLLVATVVIGFFICGAVHIAYSYHHSASLDGQESPVAAAGGRVLNRTHRLALQAQEGQISTPGYSQPKHLLFGAGLAAALQWASMTMPQWPLHPIGLFIVFTYYGRIAWASIFLGWLLKVVLVRYGGSRLYRLGRPFFIGMILGEVLSTAFWCIVSTFLVALGIAYQTVDIQPG